MKIDINIEKGFSKEISWLEKLKNPKPMSTLNNIGRKGVEALALATPKNTAETAHSWHYKVNKTARGYEVAYYNDAHTETWANVALLLQLGHGTGTGGWVEGRDYINPALRSIFETASDVLQKELIK